MNDESQHDVLLDYEPSVGFKVFLHFEADKNIEIVLESLLNSKFIRSDHYWRLSYEDLVVFRSKLDDLGIESRGATEEAWEELSICDNAEEELNRIKEGEYNDDLELFLNELKTDLYNDQKIGVRFLASQFRSGLFDEMGIGKTIQMLATVIVWKKLDLIDNVLVITKNDVKGTWRQQILEHTNLSYKILGNGQVMCLHGLDEYESNPADILIAHYESIRIDSVKERLIQIGFNVVLLDESHLIKNEEAQRSKAVTDLVEKTDLKERDLRQIFVELKDGRVVKRVINFDVKQFEVGEEIKLEGVI